jgi:hypothetical protein
MIPAQAQNMGIMPPRSTTTTNATSSQPRNPSHPAPLIQIPRGDDQQITSDSVTELTDELTRILGRLRREATANQPPSNGQQFIPSTIPINNRVNIPPPIPLPPMPQPPIWEDYNRPQAVHFPGMGGGSPMPPYPYPIIPQVLQPGNTLLPGLPPQPRPTGPPHFAPPPPYVDDTFKDFSQLSAQEYYAHESRLYQRVNFHAKIRLGYGKAVAVLHRHLEGSSEYEGVIRPYQIDQPEALPPLSPLIPNSEARLFADTVRALVDIIGVQRAVFVLENAKPEEVPGIHYEVQRVPIPSQRATPIPLEKVPEPVKVPDVIGPFARSRSGSFASTISSPPSNWSWHGPLTELPVPPSPPAPSSMTLEDLTRQPGPIGLEDLPPPPPIQAPPATPTTPVHRGILRRSSSGQSLNGKRVTINECPCNRDHCHSPVPYEMNNPLSLSPVPMSPIKLSDENSPFGCGNLRSPDLQPRARSIHNNNCQPIIKPEEGVLQAMAAAQM